MSQISGTNRNDRATSFDSTTSVVSTGSKDSGFSVNDVASQVGHMNGSIVAKSSANQKPSTFFGWLKSLLGFGGSNSNSSEKIARSFTTSPEFTQKTAEKDPLGDQHDASARTGAIDDNIKAIEILAKQYPANQELQSILKDAQSQSKIANTLNEKDSLDHADLLEIKGAFDRVIQYTKDAAIQYTKDAAKIDRREAMKNKASGQNAALNKIKQITLQRDLIPAPKGPGIFDKESELKQQDGDAIFRDEPELREEYKKLDQLVQAARNKFGETSAQVQEARTNRKQYIDAHSQFKHLFGDTLPESQSGVGGVAAAINTTGLGSTATQHATENRKERFRPPGI